MLKLLKRVLLTLFIFVCLFILTICFFVFTNPGAKLALDISRYFTPNNLKVKYVNPTGNLYNGLNIDEVKIIDANKKKIFEATNNFIQLDFNDLNFNVFFKSDRITEFENNITINKINLTFIYDILNNIYYLKANSEKDNKLTSFRSLYLDIDIIVNYSDKSQGLALKKFDIYDNFNNLIKIESLKPNEFKLISKIRNLVNKDYYNFDLDTNITLNPNLPLFENIKLNFKRISLTRSNDIILEFLKGSKTSNNNQIDYKNNEVNINPTCFNILENKICLQGNINLKNNLVNLKGNLRNIKLDILKKYFDNESLANVEINSDNQADFNIQYNFKKNIISNSKILFKNKPGFIFFKDAKTKYYFKESELLANIDKNNLTATLNVNLENFDHIKGRIEVSNILDPKKVEINSSIDSNITNLKPITLLLPDSINNLEGKFICNYKINGKIDSLRGLGACSLTNASFVLINLNIKIVNLNLEAKIKGNEVNFSGNLESENSVQKNLGINGNGKLNIVGSSRLDKDFLTNININGSNFLGENSSNAILYFSPNIKLEISTKGMNINGSVDVPQARIYGGGASSSLERKDVIFVDKKAQKEQNSQDNFHINGNLKVNISENVKIEMKNFISNLIGNISLNFKDSFSSIFVTGVLELKNGSFNIYDQTLTISKGVLNYINNPIDNPIVNLQAERPINLNGFNSSYNRAYVGISLTGPLGNPKLNLISNPSMTKEDIMSYLIFGVASNDADKAQISILLKALQSAMGFTNSGDSFLGSILNVFKFDEIKMESINTTDPMGIPAQSNQFLVLGKKITDKLFIRYGFNLFDPLGLLQARYNFGHNVGFETSFNSYGELNADLIYFKESN